MFDTIIIGAGIAGIAAGQYLIENGQENFIVLESADKIGGRVNTIEFDNKVFPTGPGWLHGRIGNPLYDIMSEVGIPLEECKYEDEAYFVWDVEEKRDITIEYREKSRLLEENFEKVEKKVENKEIDSRKSVFQVLRDHSNMFPLKSDIDKIVMFTNKEIYMGTPIKKVSAKVDFHFDRVYSLDNEESNFRILDPLGVPKMIDYLSQDFKTKIKLGYKVGTIQWNRNNSLVIVKTTEGLEFRSKNVIVTLPCNLLAKEVIIFEPAMPVDKIEAWKHIPSVNYCRLFAKFPQRFWPDKDWLISVNKNTDPFNELIMWQNCSKQNLCSYDDNILICHFTSGSDRGSSRFDVDRETLLEIVEESMRNMFPLTYCKPEDVRLISHWNNERFGGSFSISSPGLNGDMIEALSQSVGPLHFAGESVSVELMGTMQAAYITGRKAAESTFN